MKLDFLTEEGKLFFKDLFMGTMRDREERNIIRPDMIHLLMEAKKGGIKCIYNITCNPFF